MHTLHDIQNIVIMCLMHRLDINQVMLEKSEIRSALEQIHVNDGYTNMKTEISDEGEIRVTLSKEG